MFVANVAGRELDREVFQRVTLMGYLVFKEEPLRLSGFVDDNFAVRMNVMAYLAGNLDERQLIPVSWE